MWTKAPQMKTPLATLFVASLCLFEVACTAPSPPMTCAQAGEILAQCSLEDQEECGDDSPAALAILGCDEGGEKADLLGNGVPGDSCHWNWQCKGDERFTCIAGNCFLENTEGNRCDRGDERDCLPALRCVDDLTNPSEIVGICSQESEVFRPELYAETIRPGEELDFEANAAQLLRMMLLTALQRLNGDEVVRRAFHAYKYACAKAEFEVLDSIPQDMKIGPVFAEAKTFPTWVRFSKGSIAMPDASFVQGLALKLMGVEGGKVLGGEEATASTQDFVLINLPATPTSNANEFVELAQAQFDGGLATAAYMITHPKVALKGISLTSGTVDSLRTQSYWGGGAYRYGDRAMKYSARPCPGTFPVETPADGNDVLLDSDLDKILVSSMEVCFDFYVQIQKDSVEQSIEDSSSEWDLAAAPAVRVARLTIPQVTNGEDEVLCNDFSFNPWHSAPEYRPLGDVNRARRFAYEASRMRRGSSSEPTP